MRNLRLLFLVPVFLLNLSAFAQRDIEGKVFDSATNEPLSGVLVLEKTANVNATTDSYGKFKITIPNEATTLEFSISGFGKMEFILTQSNTVNIGLKEQSGLSLDKVIVIGSRNQSRKKSETPVAVDIISVADVMSQTGQLELNQILHYAVPSFNANRQTGADLADHVDPSSMRGLGPDQVLFLLNGKRLRPSSIINIFGVRGRGNAGTDLNSIPASAVERIEVLRDGAAAQYGSDAVAGVINIVLKGNQTGTTGSLGYGTNVTGYGASLNYDNLGKIIPSTVDGGMLNATVTHGFKMGKGNLSITADYLAKGTTYRSNNETAFPDKNYRSQFGDAQLRNTSLYLNGSFPLKKGEIYVLGGYNTRSTKSNIWNISFDDTTRNVYEIFNKPYFPRILTNISNVTSTAGYKATFGKWNADFSHTFGTNAVEVSTNNTLNPSLLTKSPTTFFNGNQHYFQNVTDIDFNRNFDKLNLAFGTEFRSEKYETLRGDEASWKTYDNPAFELTDPATGDKYWAKKVGTSQGFPGLRPEQEVNAKRTNVAVYADAEYDVSNNFMLAGAVRYENYSDFGGTFGGKLATRIKLNKNWALRGSVQTGFRAPSLTQIYFQSTINDVDAQGNNFEKIVANNRSELAKRSNIPSLTAEKSINQGIGLVFSPNENMHFTVDGYGINVKDRIVLTGAFFNDDKAIGTELTALNVKAAQFYVNALDTKTIGLDVTGSFKMPLGKGFLNITLAGNINKMTLAQVKTPERLKGKEDKVLSPRELQYILSAAPRSKFYTAFDYKIGKFSTTLRLTYFSGLSLIGTNGTLGFDPTLDVMYYANKAKWLTYVLQNYKPRVVPDLVFNYDLAKKIRLSVGGNNILDVYPTIQNSGSTDGGGMWDGVQMGHSGAYFFSKLTLRL